MNAQTKLSAKGQVVIPKNVRDRLGLVEGTVFDVIESSDGVTLRLPVDRGKLSVEEAQKKIREIFIYAGPRLSDAQIAAAGPAMAAAKYRRLAKQTTK